MPDRWEDVDLSRGHPMTPEAIYDRWAEAEDRVSGEIPGAAERWRVVLEGQIRRFLDLDDPVVRRTLMIYVDLQILFEAGVVARGGDRAAMRDEFDGAIVKTLMLAEGGER